MPHGQAPRVGGGAGCRNPPGRHAAGLRLGRRGAARAHRPRVVRHRHAGQAEALEYGDKSWSSVMADWNLWKEEGLTEHENWWPGLYRAACARVGHRSRSTCARLRHELRGNPPRHEGHPRLWLVSFTSAGSAGPSCPGSPGPAATGPPPPGWGAGSPAPPGSALPRCRPP